LCLSKYKSITWKGLHSFFLVASFFLVGVSFFLKAAFFLLFGILHVVTPSVDITCRLSVGTVAPSCVVLTVAPSCVVLNELSCSSTLCLFDVLAPSLLVPGGLPAFPFLSRLSS